MTKYQRYQPAISRNSDNVQSEDQWLQRFEQTLEKGAVQPRVQESLFDQINSIMNRKSRYATVEAAVDDMKERSGLTAYLKKAKDEEQSMTTITTAKTATAQEKSIEKNSKLPLVIQKCPQVMQTFENVIKSSKGNLPLPAIIERVRSIHQNDVSEAKDWDQDDLMYLVSQLNLDAKKNNPTSYNHYSNLGARDSIADSEMDQSNTDAFYALNPAK